MQIFLTFFGIFVKPKYPKMNRVFPLIFGLVLPLLSFSLDQHPKIDSLNTVLQKAKTTQDKVDVYNLIAYEYIYIKYDSIKPNAERAINLAKKINYNIGIADAEKNLAVYYFFEGNREESFKLVRSAIATYKLKKDTARMAKGYNNLANLHKNFGLLEEALTAYDTAIYFNKKINVKQGLFNNYYNVGGIFLKQGDLKKALDYYYKANAIIEDISNNSSKAKVLSGLGLVYEAQGKFDSAIVKLDESLKIFKAEGKTRDAVAMANNLANITRKQGDYLNSIAYFNEALKTARDIGNPRMEAILLINLANNYLELNDDKTALELYEKSAKIIKGVDDYAYAASLSNIALILEDKQPEEAIRYLEESNAIYRKMNSIPQLINNLNNEGNNQFRLKQYNDSKTTYLEANQYLKTRDLDYLKTSTYLGLSNANLALNEIDSAYYYASKGLELARFNKTISSESEAAELLHKIEKIKGNFKMALNYLEIHESLKDSLFDQEKIRELGKLEAGLEYKNLKEQLERERETEKAQTELELGIQKNFIIVLSIILIGAFIIVILLFVIKQNKSKTNKSLQQYSKDIEDRNNYLKQLHVQKNQLISIISHDFRSPLTSLSQTLDLYCDKTLNKDEFDQWVPEINKNVKSTLGLIDKLLSWAKQSLNEFRINKTEVLLHPVIIDKITTFEDAMVHKNLNIENNISEDFSIFIDKNTLEVVLRNLMSNAIKYCNNNDSISISGSQKGNYKRLCIEDTGIGMTTETAENLFKNDDIISAIGTSKEEGSGIGAVLCKNFIEENDGRIWVEHTEINKGTKICFEVPIKKAD